ncbi:MAG: alpha-galactosidase [Clostridia bacterium]|nr:alpha-galactosidase [Clostridia bacterium]
MIFKLDTVNTSYIFEVMASGHLEHLYYGRKIANLPNTEPLKEKLGTGYGHSLAYSPTYSTLILDNICTEYSYSGKGDYHEPSIVVKKSNGIVCDFIYQSHRYIDDFAPEGLPYSHGKSSTLAIDLIDKPSGLVLTLYYTTYINSDIIVKSTSLCNNGNQSVSILKLASNQLDLPYADFTMQSLDGAWARERYINNRQLSVGITTIDSKCNSSSATHNPYVVLKRPNCSMDNGECYGMNIIYSGNHCLTAEVTVHGKTRVIQGINPFNFCWQLDCGQTFYSPETTICYSNEGTNGLTRQYHSFINNHIVRGLWANKPRPILINNWEATYFNFNQTKLLNLAKKAKSLGIELFVLDDGWFGKRTQDTRGLGDWYVNKSKLPQGLDGLCNKINDIGLDFGLWVEPEMVNPDSDLYRAHPEWAIRHPDYDYSLSRNQLLLNLTNPEVRQYLLDRLTDILSSANIKYIKWDFNRPFSDFYAPNLAEQGEFFHRYYLGLYEILNKLTKQFPHILFESCASGGCRVDMGMLCYFPQFWCSDNTDSCDRVKIQEGTLTCYPSSSIGAHVSASPNHQTLRSSTIDNRFNTACVGVLGYELDLDKLNNNELKSIGKQVEFYKKWRNTIQYGTYYQQKSIFYDNQCSWIIVDKNRQNAIVGLYNGQAPTSPPTDILQFRALNYDTLYRVSTREQAFPAKQFGDLIEVAMPHLAKTLIFSKIIENGYSIDTEREVYTAYGDLLCNAGIKLYQQFASTGWNEQVRIMMDYGSRLYEVEAIPIPDTPSK